MHLTIEKGLPMQVSEYDKLEIASGIQPIQTAPILQWQHQPHHQKSSCPSTATRQQLQENIIMRYRHKQLSTLMHITLSSLTREKETCFQEWASQPIDC